MALKKCKECGHEVAASAATCPNCGVKHPARTGISTGAGCLIIVAIVIVGGLLIDTDSTSAPAVSTPRSAGPGSVSGRVTKWAHNAVNVRSGRSTSRSVVTQLRRGESVQVDSLVNGWFRVFRGGQPIGYTAASVLQDGPIPPYEIVSWNWQKDPGFGTDGAVIWNVEVRNNTSQYVSLLRVNFATYDANGRLIESDFTYVRGLSPGGTASTKSYATYYGREERARISIDPNQ